MIAWFCRNAVAANLLMLMIVAGGAITGLKLIPIEVFPDFASDIVTVRVPFRGATPEEVEEGILLRIEEAVFDLEGIEEMTASARENLGSVSIEVEKGTDPRDFMDDLKNRVDAITTFPDDVERPIYTVSARKREVISVIVAADVPEKELRALGETVRDDLLAIPGITQVSFDIARDFEIAVEVSEDKLDAYGIRFDDVANAIRQTSLDLSAGRIRTAGGEILLRTKGQAYTGEDLREIVVTESVDGNRVTIGDVAIIRDGFEEDPLFAQFNGIPCVEIEVFRVGNQSAIDVSNKVKEYIEEKSPVLGEGVYMTYWRDRARIIRSRLQTLTSNAIQGGILVFILLTLTLRFSVAGWVCVGIPVSMLGALMVMPFIGATINIFSLFAFILVLGIVVDDAIVTGENVYRHLRIGDYHGVEAAIKGTQEVTVPVVFGILTTITAFIPILMIDSGFAKAFGQIPLVVIPVLLFSLVESKLILPAHLRHLKPYENPRNPLIRVQQWIANRLEDGVRKIYTPILEISLRWRYVVIAGFTAAALVIIILRPSGRLHFSFIPRVPGEVVTAELVMPLGTPDTVTHRHIDRIQLQAQEMMKEYVDPATGESIIRHVFAIKGKSGSRRGAHVGAVYFELVSPEKRSDKTTNRELVQAWRQKIGPIPGAQDLNFRSEIMQRGKPIAIELQGNNLDELVAATDDVSALLGQFDGVFDVTNSYEAGKQEMRLAIKPEGELLGVTTRDLARQVRQAFFGEEAQRLQRGRDDVRVMVRYPEDERRSLGDLHAMRIRTPDGQKIPIAQVAEVIPSHSSATITRIDRRRAISVNADVDKEAVDLPVLMAQLAPQLRETLANYNSVKFSFKGEEKDRRESMSTIFYGMIFILLVIYALLAIPFKSYLQPLIVMSAIPFGVAAAFLGHVILGRSLSILSFFGILALTGVVVNDSLVLVDYINRRRREGMPLYEAVATAGSHRFRPILLTSLTTFAGLMPLIFFEKSTQAQFLIPMAVSLGFGILFTTFSTLLLIPCFYMALEDFLSGKRWFFTSKSWDESVAVRDVVTAED
jgi:multidrug efflux pump subunit AcrB